MAFDETHADSLRQRYKSLGIPLPTDGIRIIGGGQAPAGSPESSGRERDFALSPDRNSGRERDFGFAPLRSSPLPLTRSGVGALPDIPAPDPSLIDGGGPGPGPAGGGEIGGFGDEGTVGNDPNASLGDIAMAALGVVTGTSLFTEPAKALFDIARNAGDLPGFAPAGGIGGLGTKGRGATDPGVLGVPGGVLGRGATAFANQEEAQQASAAAATAAAGIGLGPVGQAAAAAAAAQGMDPETSMAMGLSAELGGVAPGDLGGGGGVSGNSGGGMSGAGPSGSPGSPGAGGHH